MQAAELEQRQEGEKKLGYDIGVEAIVRYRRDLETRLPSLAFISNSVGSLRRVLNKGSRDRGGGGK